MSSCGYTPDGSIASATFLGKNKATDQWAIQDEQIKTTLAHITYKILVTSGKGGVGKSSITVNLACALANQGHKVGLLDCDLHGPSIPTLLGIHQSGVETDAAGHLLPVMVSDNLAVLSMDVLMQDKNQPVLWRGTKKGQAIREFMSDVRWGNLEYLFIDSPPGTGDEPMTVLESIPDALCIVVTTPQEVSLNDVRKTVNFLATVHANTLGVVENMSGLLCPHCHKPIDLFKHGGGEKLAQEHGLVFLGAIPIDPANVVAADQGHPIVLMEGDLPAKTAFMTLARTVEAACANSLEAITITGTKTRNMS